MPGDGPRAGRGSARSLASLEIEAVLRGRPIRTKRVVLYLAPASGDPGLAVIAGRRVGRAVARNRARRVLREAWRSVTPSLAGEFHAVLVARAAIAGAKTGQVVDEVAEALGEAGVTR